MLKVVVCSDDSDDGDGDDKVMVIVIVMVIVMMVMVMVMVVMMVMMMMMMMMVPEAAPILHVRGQAYPGIDSRFPIRFQSKSLRVKKVLISTIKIIEIDYLG